MNKQNLWFLTLFSLILILGVYYITMPNDILETIEKEKTETKEVNDEIIEEANSLVAMRVNLQEERLEKVEVLQEQLTNNNLTTEEKNNIYEQLKYLNEVQGKEENYEKKIKKELDIDCFTKIENSNATVVCISDKHDTTLANQIMRLIQKEYDTKMNITVKFQNK
mgnify:CR=1 FL=1